MPFDFYKVGRAITKTSVFRKYGGKIGTAIEGMKDRAFLMSKRGRERAAKLDAAHNKKGYLKKTLLSQPGAIRGEDYAEKAGYIMADRRIARGGAVRHQIGGSEPLMGRKPIKRSVAHENQYKLYPGSPMGKEQTRSKVMRGWNDRAFARDKNWRAKRHYEELTGEKGLTLTPVEKNEGLGHIYRRGMRMVDVGAKKKAVTRLGRQVAGGAAVGASGIALSAYHQSKKKTR